MPDFPLNNKASQRERRETREKIEMRMMLDDLLEERKRSHGDFGDVATIVQSTKLLWRGSKG